MRVAPCLLLVFPITAFGQDNAAQFDGSDDWLNYGTLNPGVSFTLEAWVRFDAVTGYHTVFEVIDVATGFNTTVLLADGAQWNTIVDDPTANEGDNCTPNPLIDGLCTATSYPAAGSMHHLALVLEGSTAIRLYVDGSLVGQNPLSAGKPLIVNDRWSSGLDTAGGDGLLGVVDEVRIWSKARTSAEIQCTVNYQLVGIEPGLHRLFDLDVAVGSTTFPDRVTGATGVTVNGTAFTVSPFSLKQSTGYDITCLDYDLDGFTIDTGDCDETKSSVYPGAVDIWYDGVDANCDKKSDYDQDGDGTDKKGSPTVGASDCNDTNPAIKVGAVDVVADGIDQDCSGGDLCYQDKDDDGFGIPTTVPDDDLDCSNASKLTSKVSTDCNDADAFNRPGGVEVVGDGADQDCSGTDSCYKDADDDGYGTSAVIVDNDLDCSNASKLTSKVSTDCNDSSALIRPGGVEVVADGIDQDCLAGDTCYQDKDDDGYGTSTLVADDDLDCGNASKLTSKVASDCDDATSARHPGAAQVWYDGVDQPCTGAQDSDQDGDGQNALIVGGKDCNDTDPRVLFGALEVDGNGIDDDCSGEDESGDTDGDGVSDGLELFAGTDYKLADTDGDGIDDGIELGDPTAATNTDRDAEIDALDEDSDNDGASDLEEGTGDSDCDGLGDWRDPDPAGCDTGLDTDTSDTSVDTDPIDTDSIDTDPIDTDPIDSDPIDTAEPRLFVPSDTDRMPVIGEACGCASNSPSFAFPALLVALVRFRRRR